MSWRLRFTYGDPSTDHDFKVEEHFSFPHRQRSQPEVKRTKFWGLSGVSEIRGFGVMQELITIHCWITDTTFRPDDSDPQNNGIQELLDYLDELDSLRGEHGSLKHKANYGSETEEQDVEITIPNCTFEHFQPQPLTGQMVPEPVHMAGCQNQWVQNGILTFTTLRWKD